jgi:hypothetical protein
MAFTMSIELFKAGLSLLVSLITIVLGWQVGQKLTFNWNILQKRRETELANVQQFYFVYGEFRELSKTWRLMKKTDLAEVSTRPAIRWALLTNACALESKLESVNIKLATERQMSPDQLYFLGLFRQAIQTLRESIRDDLEIASSSRGIDYDYFNELASRVATIITCDPVGSAPDQKQSILQLRHIADVARKDFESSLEQYVQSYPTK